MIGTTLLHYRIVEMLGSGGMGAVYRAEDLRLHRNVALKILPPELSANQGRLQRFLREAQVVASLNHPNIVTLYDVEEADGIHFLTMELVDGATLAELRPERGFPIPEFLRLAISLADAVSAAHERGVVHRDLKPTNVMLSTEGRLKVLDFGLAKVRQTRTDSRDLETETAVELTAGHAVIGTAAYMSPEQAQGEPVDNRSDIFSLGVLLYELATGTRPFGGSKPLTVLSAIIRDSPTSPDEINNEIPPELARIILRCLAKEPTRRYQSTADLRIDLEDVQRSMSEGSRTVEAVAVGSVWPWIVAVATVVAVVGTATIVVWMQRAGDAGPPAPVSIDVKQLTSAAGIEWFPSLSPDGQWVVYAGDVDQGRHIFLQSRTGSNAIDISGDVAEDDDQPVFSPNDDGERIAFRSSRNGGGLFVMGRTGEALRRITDFGFRPTWSPDGRSLAFATENVELYPQNSMGTSELWVVEVATQKANILFEGDAFMPAWSPHGTRIAFARRFYDQGIWSIPADGGEPTPVILDDRTWNWSPAWSPDGSLLYFVSDRSGSQNLWRVAIDENTGEVRSEPEAVTLPVAFVAHPAISRDGRSIAFSSTLVTQNIQRMAFDANAGEPAGDLELEWVTTGSRRWSSPDPSPDGTMVSYYSLSSPEGDLYLSNVDGTNVRQLTSDEFYYRVPRWSPDGEWIASFSDKSGQLDVWRIRPDGRDLERLTQEGGSDPTWSPDGESMAAFGRLDGPPTTWIFHPDRPWDDPGTERLPAMDPPTHGFAPSSWSPDGMRIAGYEEFQGSVIGIAVYSVPEHRFDQLTDFGEWPVWLPDSRRILFVAGGSGFYVVDTRTRDVTQVYYSRRDVLGPPRLTRDGTVAFYSRRVTESDVWIATLR